MYMTAYDLWHYTCTYQFMYKRIDVTTRYIFWAVDIRKVENSKNDLQAHLRSPVWPKLCMSVHKHIYKITKLSTNLKHKPQIKIRKHLRTLTIHKIHTIICTR